MPTGYNATGESVLNTPLDLVGRTSLAALIATPNLELARRLDRVVVLEDGRLRRVARAGDSANARRTAPPNDPGKTTGQGCRGHG